uniref:Uncharacterized protein n=1 Tax=Lepeophtheirus salmonis TaxID=72036 RepID=A0A0K2T0B8_LEPSM
MNGAPAQKDNLCRPK